MQVFARVLSMMPDTQQRLNQHLLNEYVCELLWNFVVCLEGYEYVLYLGPL